MFSIFRTGLWRNGPPPIRAARDGIHAAHSGLPDSEYDRPGSEQADESSGTGGYVRQEHGPPPVRSARPEGVHEVVATIWL